MENRTFGLLAGKKIIWQIVFGRRTKSFQTAEKWGVIMLNGMTTTTEGIKLLPTQTRKLGKTVFWLFIAVQPSLFQP